MFPFSSYVLLLKKGGMSPWFNQKMSVEEWVKPLTGLRRERAFFISMGMFFKSHRLYNFQKSSQWLELAIALDTKKE